MDIRLAKLTATLGLAVILAGCTEEKVPEPTADNCAPEMYQKNLASLSKESSRNEFTANCKSFLAAKKMTSWKFEKSAEDKY
ncbi:entry exclusion lipoprotein TrbK [Pseudomonas oryzicola]|uniref:Entry exclusion lipoprotein TrbK n=1 Tax=Pseudomonas oryzicola TaxID=485876 RepID=A0ABS6Q9U5_9PSED|nr:entry exclusion lipoprotein TrbK [Pseudomonas oryzicola]MBV4490949.1 entry exclusion lipoprotein TrbK [Pseudomonas oryzicola]